MLRYHSVPARLPDTPRRAVDKRNRSAANLRYDGAFGYTQRQTWQG